jgi:hypothetical protein
MKNPKLSIALCGLLFSLLPAGLSAQNPRAVLTYYDDRDELTVYDFAGNEITPVYIGYPLLIGYSIETGASNAELEMKPNGSIIKIQENTFMKIEEMQGTKNAKTNRLARGRGLLRFVAAKLFGSSYVVYTPSSVLGVRGTDFVVSIDDEKETGLLINEGLVEAYLPADDSLHLFGPGQAAEIRQDAAELIESEMDEVRSRINRFSFTSVSPDRVPRRAPRDYYIAFDYYQDFDREAFRQFFEEEQYFADYKRYIEKFESYYRQEMRDFEEKFAEELEEFRDFRSDEMEQFFRFRNRSRR